MDNLDNFRHLSPVLATALGTLSSFFEGRRKAVSPAVTTPAFHYTSMAGLAGMLESNSIWFTDIFHLNDPSEMIYARKFADEILRELGAVEDRAIKTFCEKMISGMDQVNQRFQNFVACFSLSNDDLGQWRAYADNGRGACLGLSDAIFRETAASENPVENHFLIKVSYDEASARAEQKLAVERAVSILRDEVIRHAANDSEDRGRQFLIDLSTTLSTQILFNTLGFKHPAYIAEQEVRLLIIAERDAVKSHVQIRHGNGRLVPYISCPISPSFRDAGTISSIAVGPASLPTSEDSVGKMLDAFGYPRNQDGSQIRIVRSPIPYRAN